MGTLLAFALSLVLITAVSVRYRMPPFLTLVAASVVFGILAGMPFDIFMPAITAGAGRIFSLLGIVIFAGVGIAQVLRESGLVDQIVTDVRRVAKQPLSTAGVAGFLLSVPLMCGITSFVIISPIVARLRADREGTKLLLYTAGVAGIISYVLLFPAPVIYTIVSTLGTHPQQPWQIDAVTLPVSLLLLVLLLLAVRRRSVPLPTGNAVGSVPETSGSRRLRAWLPFAVLFLMLGVGSAFPPLRPLSNINIALIAALLTALAGVPADVRLEALGKGTRNAGIIIFDLAGAGAFGGVVAASAFPSEISALAGDVLPVIVLPFAIAALLQAAQGSRVVTAAITSTILSTTAVASTIHPVSLVLMISAGAFMFSYVSDPFFWLIQRTTGDGIASAVRHYTLPLSAAGLVTLAAALIIQFSVA